MSAKSEAKARQGYRTKHTPCRDCRHFTSKFAYKSFYSPNDDKVYTYTTEYEKRCGLGGFAVGKLSTCNEFAPK